MQLSISWRGKPLTWKQLYFFIILGLHGILYNFKKYNKLYTLTFFKELILKQLKEKLKKLDLRPVIDNFLKKLIPLNLNV